LRGATLGALGPVADPVAAEKSTDFLFDELAERIAKGPIGFRVLAQLANGEDTVDDATIHWPQRARTRAKSDLIPFRGPRLWSLLVRCYRRAYVATRLLRRTN
jgi:hypothetical protein